jgi:hypothetical protein
MSKRLAAIAVPTMLTLLYMTSVVHAAKGIVVYNRVCDYFIVETSMGYSILEWYGGNDPSEGDMIVGDFESYGFADLHNTTKDIELRVWVEDYWLSRDRAIEEWWEHCK